MNIPNILTVLRFLLVPVFGYYLFNKEYSASIVLFTLGGITDILDGYIARKYNLITPWGRIADPLADKFMQITALILLTNQGLIPAVVSVIIVAKDVFMGLGSILLYRKDKMIVSANWYGKLATVIFYFVIVSIIFLGNFEFTNREIFIDIATGIAVIFALFAFFMYSMEFRKIRSDTGQGT